MIEPNVLAFQNIPLLEAIGDKTDAPWGLRALASHLERDESNLNKTLKRLQGEGILGDPPLSGLTDAGREQLAAYKRAKHGIDERNAARAQAAGDRVDGDSPQPARWPLDKFRRNPTNRAIDPEAVLGLADAIAGVGDILMPLLASMPDADGVRTIWAGERRWLAATRLAQTGALPDALLEGLPFNEREADAGEAALITLVENGARTDLTPWEDAKQLRIAADATGLNATDLARRIGRAREGDRGGVRDVQQKLKIAREATPEAIAAYEADPAAPGAWEALRNSVVDRSGNTIVTTKAQRLALAELLHKAAGQTGINVTILPAGHSGDGQRLAQYGFILRGRAVTGDIAQVTRAGVDYLKAEGLSGSIENARHRLGFPEGYGIARYRTEWLNTPTSAAAPATSADPEVRALAGIEPITADTFEADGFALQSCVIAPAANTPPDAATAQVGIYSKEERRGISDVTLYRVRFAIHWRNETTTESSRIPGCTSLPGALQLATEDVLHEKPDLPRATIEWIDRMSGPHVVKGKDCYNGSNAQERRFAIGWDKRQSNTGGGDSARRAPTSEPAVLPGTAQRSVPKVSALTLIQTERTRQIEVEGYFPIHDDSNTEGQLAMAAAAYAASAAGDPDAPLFWPADWNSMAFKPNGTTRDLVKAGALIAAEIERRQRSGES